MDTYDVVVVGGGIMGIGCAYELARRGVRVGLFEAGDWGAETSSGCFRFVHGGLRYLQDLNFGHLFASAAEQRRIRIADSERVRVMPVVVPTKASLGQSKAFLGLGTSVYDMLSFWRNFGVAESQKIGRARFLGRSELVEKFPHLSSDEDYTGAVVFNDAQFLSCEHLGFDYVARARRCGAECRNYVRVEDIQLESAGSERKIAGLDLFDFRTDSSFSVRAKGVIFATGSRSELLSRLCGESYRPQYFSKGIQLVFSFPFDSALALKSSHANSAGVIGAKSGRNYFMVPHFSQTMVGTTDEIVPYPVGRFFCYKKRGE